MLKSALYVRSHMLIGTMFFGVLYVFTSNCQSCTEVKSYYNKLILFSSRQPTVLWCSLLIEYDTSFPLLISSHQL